jgi:outer membrane protein
MRIFILFFALACWGMEATAQKFAYIDSDYVLLHIPDYDAAQQELNRLSREWQAEIEAKWEAVERLELAYRAERVLLTPEMRSKRESEIEAKRVEAREMQKAKFGVEGELFRKRQELIQPIQDRIFEELKEICSGSGYMVVFDKSNQSNMLYTNPKYDISDRVIKALGFVPGETVEGKGEGDGEGEGEGEGEREGEGEEGEKGPGSAVDRVRGAVNGAGAGGGAPRPGQRPGGAPTPGKNQ